MSTNIKNRLKFIFAGEVLLTLFFIVVAFAVPFESKYNLTFWMSFGSVILALATVSMADFVGINSDNFNNDKCGNRISLTSVGYFVIQLVASIILFAINSETFPGWISIIITTGIFVVMTFIIIAAIITSPGDDKKEEE